MTRAQFLNDLYRLLAGNGMDTEQAEQHLVYYAEMLADRMEEGMSEDRAVASMEDVDTIARRILEEEGKVYRPLSEIPTAPPAAPDASKLGGGGKRGYQVPKKWSGKRLAQIALWTLAIVIALGAASRWLWMRNVRHSSSETVDYAIPVEEMAPYAEVYEGYGWEIPYEYGYEYCGGVNSSFGSSLRKLDIEWAAGTVFVQGWSGDEIQLQEYSRSELTERNAMVIADKEDELTIRYREGTSLGNVKGDKWLTVMVPDGMLAELEIETTSAGVQLNGLELGEIDVTTTSGEVRVVECYVQKADVETVSGDVNVSDLYADELDVSTTSGDIDGYVYCRDVDLETTSGDANVYSEGAAEQVELSTTSGDMRLTVEDASIRSIQADSTSGNIILSLPWDIGFTLDFSTVSGKLTHTFDAVMQDGKLICNGGGCQVDVETVSGNLDIY